MLAPAPAPLSLPATAAPQRRGALGLLAAGAWAVFGSMATLVYCYRLAPFDEPALRWLHRCATPPLDGLALQLTTWGNTVPMIAAGVLTTAALASAGRRRAAGLFALGVGGSMLLTQVIKHVATRPRPALWLSLRPEYTFSFPSGHAMDTAALAAALFFAVPPRWRGWWAVAPLFALGVGWARLYLGVHYPSDVLAGWSSAVGWVLLVQLLAARRLPGAPPRA
ncbi:MAG: phosphatase PAP2 family protein [Janthinobacterium lividum]